jgi:hypothetical protein
MATSRPAADVERRRVGQSDGGCVYWAQALRPDREVTGPTGSKSSTGLPSTSFA